MMKKQQTRQLKGWVLWAIALGLIVVDQVVKISVKTTMTLGESHNVIGDWFRWCFVENEGAAFGMSLGGDYGKLALSLFRIVAIGVLVWAGVPHLPNIVRIDVALVKSCANTCAGTDGSVYLDTTNAHTCHAAEEPISNLGLVSSEEALAGVVTLDASLLAGGFYKLHKSSVLLGREL